MVLGRRAMLSWLAQRAAREDFDREVRISDSALRRSASARRTITPSPCGGRVFAVINAGCTPPRPETPSSGETYARRYGPRHGHSPKTSLICCFGSSG